MKIASITPAIKIIKESAGASRDIYIALGDNIRVWDCERRVFTGVFLYMELGRGDKEDSIILDIGGENINIQCSWILDIQKV